MPRGLRCFTCGGWGHMAFECSSNRSGRTGLVDEQYPASVGDSSAPKFANATVPGPFGSVNEWPGTWDPNVLGVTEESAQEAQRSLEACAMISQRNRQRIKEKTRRSQGPLNVMNIGLTGSGGDRPLQQAGRGALPGARIEKRYPVGAGSGLLGTPRVERPDTGRRQRGRRDPIDGDDDSSPTRRPSKRRVTQEDSLEQDRGSNVGGDQGDAPLHWTAPQYEVADGEAVAMNLEVHDAKDLLDQMRHENPLGTRFSMNIIPVPVKDSAASKEIIKGRYGPFFPTERQPRMSHQDTRPWVVNPEDASAGTEVIKGRFLGSLVTTEDPFTLLPPEDNVVKDQVGNTATPDAAMNEQRPEEGAQDTILEGFRGRRGKTRTNTRDKRTKGQ